MVMHRFRILLLNHFTFQKLLLNRYGIKWDYGPSQYHHMVSTCKKTKISLTVACMFYLNYFKAKKILLHI